MSIMKTRRRLAGSKRTIDSVSGKMLVFVLGLITLLGLGGCASPEPPPPPPPAPEPIARTMPEPTIYVPDMITIPIYYQATGLHQDARDAIDDYIAGIDYPERLNFVIEGYTCTEGDRDYNKMLSKWRAEAVKRYMVSRGIDETSIMVIGHGVEDPIASNRTRLGRVKNRRVTITATKPY